MNQINMQILQGLELQPTGTQLHTSVQLFTTLNCTELDSTVPRLSFAYSVVVDNESNSRQQSQ